MSELHEKKVHQASSTGLEENVAGLLCYLAGFITGLIFLSMEKKSSFVRFHAMQSTVFLGGVTVVDIILTFIPFLGIFLTFFVNTITFIFWIILMVKAYNNQRYKLPIVGNISENLLSKY
ncbi:MAG TPA: DUF4870 domain-containing protein [Bacillales bacterium]|nr:DUF4870 domain-containing protein [Bacillales bacterium]